MKCTRLTAKCDCGGLVSPHSFWITEDKRLLITGQCIQCDELVHSAITAELLFKFCPKPDVESLDEAIGDAVEEITNQTEEKDDNEFLRQFHIKGDL